MNPILKNILVFILAVFIGSIANYAIIMLSGMIVPYPEGVNVTDLESIKASVHLYEAKHWVLPLLAHAIGTLVGAYIVTKFAATHHKKLALGVGVLFLIGGIMNIASLQPPIWFCVIDLIFAYIPMALLGYKLANK